ncbi:MAG: phosphotransferase family protein [Acidobacteria bacterium]|nr:phosphotransferase family protein [Acidobacteriota bacterium]MCI0621623.1 phosphotransferase family protein [Acidobacteriota bacterium]
MIPQLQRILDQMPGWQQASVTPLEGGITNRNFRVDVQGEAFVVRLWGEDTHLLGIDRGNEYLASPIVSQLGVGAQVVGFLEAENALITRFITGRSITPEEAAQPELLRRIVASIRNYHHGPAFPGTFNAFDTVRAYHRLALHYGVGFPEVLPKVLELMEQIEHSLSSVARPAPCHNDLLAGNFIDDGHTVAPDLESRSAVCGELISRWEEIEMPLKSRLTSRQREEGGCELPAAFTRLLEIGHFESPKRQRGT